MIYVIFVNGARCQSGETPNVQNAQNCQKSPKITCSSRISFINQPLIMRNSLEIIKLWYWIVSQNYRRWNIQEWFQSNLKIECAESGPFIGEIAISYSRARNSINSTILHTKAGNSIVRMSVMAINGIIMGPKRHLEDENRICEMPWGPMFFFVGAKEQRSGRWIRVLDYRECV